VLKNALDWLVGSGELVDKPIALLNASPRSTYAQASLMETIRVMSARIVGEASIAVPLPGRKLTEHGMVEDAEISSLVTRAIEAFGRALEGHQMETAEAGSVKGE
jgi:NAD(P)H-dependent FMN reductase